MIFRCALANSRSDIAQLTCGIARQPKRNQAHDHALKRKTKLQILVERGRRVKRSKLGPAVLDARRGLVTETCQKPIVNYPLDILRQRGAPRMRVPILAWHVIGMQDLCTHDVPVRILVQDDKKVWGHLLCINDVHAGAFDVEDPGIVVEHQLHCIHAFLLRPPKRCSCSWALQGWS